MSKYGFAKLGTDNYATWRTRMRGFLLSKDLAGAIEDVEHADSEKAKGFLIMCVEDQHLPTIEAAETAAEAWAALQQLYQQHSTARLIRLKRELATLRKRADENITEYVSRARTLANHIAAAGAEVDDDSLLHSVLSGLPSKYDTIRTIMTTADDLPTLAEAQAKLLLVEGDKSDRDRGNGEAAYFSGAGSGNRGPRPPQHGSRAYVPPHRRDAPAHASSSPSGSRGGHPKRKETRTCHYCHKKGHLKWECRQRLQDEARKGGDRNPDGDRAAVVALTAAHNKEPEMLTAADAVESPQLPWILTSKDFDTSNPINQWVLDSGAAKHITGHREILLR